MSDFSNTMRSLATDLLMTTPFTVGEWQSKNVSRIRQMDTFEIIDVNLRFDIPQTGAELVKMMDPYPNLDWADEHFLERVGGVPLNPAPSHERWPWGRHNGDHQNGPAQTFSHTYPERMWPRFAGKSLPAEIEKDMDHTRTYMGYLGEPKRGIRFDYGDLQDVVNLLVRSPHTRQAYLPIWFPEDTGAAHRQRVPCTLGYHFMIRQGQLSCRYYMRSCDLIRHFADDVYLAALLMQWVTDQWNIETHGVKIGVPGGEALLLTSHLRMYIASLHAFAGDKYTLERLRDDTGSSRCPTCESHDPKLHPSMQPDGGEVQICKDQWHNVSSK